MNRKPKLIIVGAGGHGRVCADIALKMDEWDTIAFLDDDPELMTSMDILVIGTTRDVEKLIPHCDVFVALGNNKLREEIQAGLESIGANLPVLCHPAATIGQGVSVGPGSVVMAGSVINPYTTIGRGCIINTGSTVDHDCVIGNYVHVSPGVHVAGSVSIGDSTWLGIGSLVSNNLSITGRCVIGAGAVVVDNITEPGTYVGVPARRTAK